MQNFGNINNAFNEILIQGITKKDDNKKSLYKKYLKSLKENKILKNQYLIYKNLENKVETDSNKAAEYVSENISLLQDFNISEIKEANDRLISLLGENRKLLNNDYSNKFLHENISFLITNKKNSANIDEILESKHKITEHIINNEGIEPINESAIPTTILGELVSKKFNEKYGTLDESTKSALKIIIESDEKKQKIFFKESINDCIDLVNKNLKDTDINTKEKLLEVKDRLLRMDYKKEGFSKEIIKLMSLREDLKS